MKYIVVCLFFVLPQVGIFSQQEPDSKPLVVASASIFADMARMVGGNLIEVRSIVPIGGDPHIYEPTPADVQLVTQADLLLVNGLTFEGWINELIANSGNQAPVHTITRGVQVIGSTEYENASDPHAWMNARNGLIYVDNILSALQTLAPEYSDEFAFNAGYYKQQIEDLDQFIHDELAEVPTDKRVLITSHDAFQYYGRAYDLRVEAALGTSTDAEVQTEDIARLTRVIRELQVPAIFIESTINPKLLRQIAKDNEVVIGGELFADSLSDPAHPAGTYIGMLKHNTKQIASALLGLTGDIGIKGGPTPLQQGILLGVVLLVMIGSFGYMVYQLNVIG